MKGSRGAKEGKAQMKTSAGHMPQQDGARGGSKVPSVPGQMQSGPTAGDVVQRWEALQEDAAAAGSDPAPPRRLGWEQLSDWALKGASGIPDEPVSFWRPGSWAQAATAPSSRPPPPRLGETRRSGSQTPRHILSASKGASRSQQQLREPSAAAER